MKNKIEALEKEKEELRKACAEVQAPFDKKLREIDDLLWAEKLDQAKNLVGKCFVFRNNCYSCPRTKDDYWDTYYKIIELHVAADANDRDYLRVLGFEKDSIGRITITQSRDHITDYRFNGFNSKYQPISREEFDKRLSKLLEEIDEVSK